MIDKTLLSFYTYCNMTLYAARVNKVYVQGAEYTDIKQILLYWPIALALT